VSEPGCNAVYAIRCAVPNYSWAQHLADAKTTGTCQNMHLASGTEAWDFVVLQARAAPRAACPGSAAAWARLYWPRWRGTAGAVRERPRCWLSANSPQRQCDTETRDCMVLRGQGFFAPRSGAACCVPCVGAAGLHTSRCQLLLYKTLLCVHVESRHVQ